MILRLRDSGDAVKGLQRGLNKLGALLLVDGDFGHGTVTAVTEARVTLHRPGNGDADDEFQAAVAAVPDPFPLLTAPGITFIARAEVTGPDAYRASYRHPCWPGEQSGITVGIGYDLQFATSAQIAADWAPHLPAAAVALLTGVSGVAGSKERLAKLSGVDIPLQQAMAVFVKRSLPAHVAMTRAIYPSLDQLTLPRRTALVSLVFNRGNSLTDKDSSHQERREMRTIAQLLQAGKVEEVADQFDSMTRLWDPHKAGGIIQRRHDEGKLWRSGFPALQLD